MCRMGYGSWINEIAKCEHPRGFNYYWVTGEYRNDEPDATDTDQWALNNGYVSVTPTRVDVTDHLLLKQMKDYEEL